MTRCLNLRQVEAFKAVIEYGTVSRAAEMMNISQSAMSKLIAHLEADTGLQLFDRIKGRLAPTRRGMRLYEEIDRIFAGVRQVENAVEAIRRDEQSRLTIGVMPALSGSFIQEATHRFLKARPGVFCSVQSHTSQWIADGLITRKLDVGFTVAPINSPYIVAEPMMACPLVCILPLDHPLAAKSMITPRDLNGTAFVSFDPESFASRRISQVFRSHGVVPEIVMVVSISPTLCEFVAAGVGVSLVHPSAVLGLRGKLAIKRFEPALQLDYQLCRIRDSRNAQLVNVFLDSAREVAVQISQAALAPCRS